MNGRNGLSHSRKGNIMDLILMASILLAIGIGFIMGGYLLKIAKEQVFTSENFDDRTSSYVSTATERYYSSFDYLFLVVFIILGLSIIVSSFLIRTSPIFIIFFIIGLIGILFIAGMGQKLFNIFIDTEGINTIKAEMPITSYILEHLSIMIGVIAVISIIGLLTNTGGGEL